MNRRKYVFRILVQLRVYQLAVLCLVLCGCCASHPSVSPATQKISLPQEMPPVTSSLSELRNLTCKYREHLRMLESTGMPPCDREIKFIEWLQRASHSTLMQYREMMRERGELRVKILSLWVASRDPANIPQQPPDYLVEHVDEIVSTYEKLIYEIQYKNRGRFLRSCISANIDAMNGPYCVTAIYVFQKIVDVEPMFFDHPLASFDVPPGHYIIYERARDWYAKNAKNLYWNQDKDRFVRLNGVPMPSPFSDLHSIK